MSTKIARRNVRTRNRAPYAPSSRRRPTGWFRSRLPCSGPPSPPPPPSCRLVAWLVTTHKIRSEGGTIRLDHANLGRIWGWSGLHGHGVVLFFLRWALCFLVLGRTEADESVKKKKQMRCVLCNSVLTYGPIGKKITAR
jgi:hypothetical protein